MSAPHPAGAPTVGWVPQPTTMQPSSVAYPAGSSVVLIGATTAPDYVLWSLFNTIFLNFFCLGFVALVYSIKARDRKVVGDMAGAFNYGRTAKKINTAVMVIVAIWVTISIICTIIITAAAR